MAGTAARAAGADWRGLAWTGDKPATGLTAAARAARHRLIADAAREAGARVVLFAHTADDIAEAERMRAEGSTLGRLRDWSPSPAWPEGRGLMLQRPLLDARRAELRAWLRDQGAGWIDDPANEDPRFARARARRALDGRALESATEARSAPRGLAAVEEDLIRLSRDADIAPRKLTGAFTDLGARLGLDWAQGTAALMAPSDVWERLLVAGLARDFQQMRLDFLRRLARRKGAKDDPEAAVAEWAAEHEPAIRQFRAMIHRAQKQASVAPAMLAQIASQARNLLAR